MNARRQAAALNAIGVIVLLIGMSAAVLVYRHGQTPGKPAIVPGEWQDGSLSMTESKTSTRDIELYGGKVEVLVVKWQDRLTRPDSVAFILATTTVLTTLGCFLGAWAHRPNYTDLSE
jgi:hypothetical protein